MQVKFVPGLYETEHHFVAGVTFDTSDGAVFIAGRLHRVKDDAVFVPGTIPVHSDRFEKASAPKEMKVQ